MSLRSVRRPSKPSSRTSSDGPSSRSKPLLLVGLTGGIATGKSAVASLLAERGAIVVDADLIAREVVEPGTAAWSKIVEHFGPGVILPDKRVDRAKLGEIVFNDRARLALLNEITHPEVMRRIAARLEELRDTDAIVVVDVPLLVEVGATDMFDALVVVVAGEDLQVDRLVRDRGMRPDAAGARIAAHASSEVKAARADRVIQNDGTRDELARQVDELWSHLETKRTERHSAS